MNCFKRILALLLCLVMLAASCVFTNAATVSMSVSTSFSVKSGVDYAKYNVYGSQSNHTEACTVLEFSSDEYLPIPFIGYAGSAHLLATHYSRAVNDFGYEVAGVINGSFFGTSDEALIGHVITNGKLACAHFGDTQELVVFDAKGNMSSVSSYLNNTFNANGTIVSGAIAYVNKRQDCAWSGATHKIFYFDESCGNACDSTGTNYEVVCRKTDNSEMAVGETLKGEVVAIYPSTNKTAIASGQFVLSVKTTSDHLSYLSGLKVGDPVSITVEEGNANARTAMESAIGAIANVGWLVKDGVDLTLTQSTVGTHSVTGTSARGTAVGRKPNGQYVFVTSEGGSTGVSSRSLTLRDVAAAMIKLGCSDVIRMDGGGSSAMYVCNTGSGSPGYVQSHSRSVCDTILIVKKSSLVDNNLIAALNTAITEAKAYVTITPNAAISNAITEAEAALQAGNVTASEARDYIKKLSVSSKDSLKTLMDNAKAISYPGFSEEHLSVIRACYERASEVYSKADATAGEVVAAYTALSSVLNLSGKTVLSVGKSYTTAGTKHGSYPDDSVRLTDGSKSNPDGGSPALYSGWDAYTNAEITINLGSSMQTDTYTVYGAYGFYGILSPKDLSVSVSTDGTNYTKVGSTTTLIPIGTGSELSDGTTNMYALTVTAPAAKTAKYVKFTVTPQNFVWIDEVEVSASQTTALVVSAGKNYTTSGTKHSTFVDNGTKLTDSIKSSPNGFSVDIYSGWDNGANAIITVDLGSVIKSDVYTVYGAYGFYGIDPMKNMKVEISENGTTYKEIGTTSSLVSLGNGAEIDGDISKLCKLTVKTSNMNTARYVRFTVTPTDFVWIDEVEVAISDISCLNKLSSAVEIHGFNQYVYDSNCYIYTPSFGTLTESNINHRYTCNVILTKTSDPNVYTIKSINTANGSAANVTLASNEIMIACHSGASALSAISHTLLKEASVGEKVTFYGVDFTNKTVGVAAYALVESSSEPTSSLGDVNLDGKIDQYDYILVKRHYFETRVLSGDEFKRGDVNGDGKVDQYDYILIARHYFGTFVIK